MVNRFAVVACLVFVACGGGAQETTRCSVVTDGSPKLVSVGGIEFVREVLDGETCGPAYAVPGDLNGDGNTDLIVSALGARIEGRVPFGSVQAYFARAGGYERVELLGLEAQVRFPNKPTVFDLDADGDLDVIVPLGFFPCSFEFLGKPCGGLVLLNNRGDGTFERKDLVKSGDRRFYHGVSVVDIDADGTRDLVTVAETRDSPFDLGTSQLAVFRGVADSPGEFSAFEGVGGGLGTFPSVADIDGDGDLDVGSSEFFGEKRASYSWLENPGQGRDFQRHVISNSQGPGFGLELVPNLLGDGKLVAIGTNHTNQVRKKEDVPSEVSLFTPTADVRQPWEHRSLLTGFSPENRSGQFSPGLFGIGDIDGDGRGDIVVSGDGDPRVFVLFQRSGAVFDATILESELRQAGGMLIHDLDRDGKNELVVSGYEQHAVFIYRRK
jgi:hypothetical protein